MEIIEDILTRGVVNIIPNKDILAQKLTSGEKINIYLGIDPTATHIHLGHAVALRKLEQFAKLGHHVTFLIGDFTALIGDTSDKDGERPILTSEEITNNFKTYQQQAEKVLDFSKIKVRLNSEWLKKLSFEEIVKLAQNFSANDFLSRELIAKRLKEGKRIGLHELLYPVMQGYDSYFMDTDIQIGGADQTFNMQAGRTLQKILRNKESFVISLDYLLGTDGRKMSKSWSNAIWLDDTPEDIYAKVMAINDDLISQYYRLATSIPLKDIQAIENELQSGAHPMNMKKNLARQIVLELYNLSMAEHAEQAFSSRVQKKETPDEIPTITMSRSELQTLPVTEVLIKLDLSTSISEAKRLIQQGGVRINTQVVNNPHQTLVDPTTGKEIFIQVGKFTFRKIIIID